MSGARVALAVVIAAVLALVLALVLFRPGPHTNEPSKAPLAAGGARAQLDAAASVHPAGEWHLAAGDYANTRYSEMAQVNAQNVARLKLAFTFDTGVKRGHEAAPLVVGTTMYLVTPFPNYVYALDLTQPNHPVKWRFDPKPPKRAQGVACCDVINRGMSYDSGRLYFSTLDGQAIALDANSGRAIWRTPVADISKGETVTMAPLFAAGKVLVGNAGGEFGVRGALTALDAASGKVAWRAYSTGPDKDVLIGSDFHPFYAMDRGKDLGVKTWPGETWKTGGGTVWGWVSYDPETRTIFYGTSNPGPWNSEQRPGDNKFTAGIFARDVDTGTAKWFYQSNPHDLYDHDDINELILLDMPVNGRMRKVIAHPGRTGYMYILDRQTGEVLSADPYAHVTAYAGVDLKTGRIRPAADMQPRAGRAVRGICPAAPGGKDWNPSAFSPRTGLLYVPHLNLCMDHVLEEANYIPGTPFLGTESKFYAGPGGKRGVFTAWDPVRRRPAWQVAEDLPLWSGALATAGDVVFYGTLDGWFKARNARSGKLLWQYKMASGTVGQPISYRGPDGRQYIAIYSGVGGWVGALVAGGMDAGDPTGGLGMFRATKDLPARTPSGARLYVFALPR
ncbi:MAG: PQQ-dependent dehydrogenase, methanol/ethanol family [Tsuneonella sp.]